MKFNMEIAELFVSRNTLRNKEYIEFNGNYDDVSSTLLEFVG